MTNIEAVALWVGLHVLLMLYLKGFVGATRGKTKVNFGDGADERMQRAIRVQGNAVEDVPIAIAGLIMLGQLAAPIGLLHALGGVLFVSRILHAAGLSGSAGFTKGRLIGTLGSIIVLLVTGIACIWLALT